MQYYALIKSWPFVKEFSIYFKSKYMNGENSYLFQKYKDKDKDIKLKIHFL